MSYEDRPLSRPETMLRHPGTHSSDLTEHLGEWYEVGPRHPDEQWTVEGFDLVIAGTNLLGNLDTFGGNSGLLEFGFIRQDGFGALRDVGHITLHSTATAAEWREGDHTGSVVDPAAHRREDGERELGLRGDPAAKATGVDPARWQGPPKPLRYGRTIEAAGWDAHALLDSDGVALPGTVIAISVTPGDSGPWTRHIVADTPAALVRGHASFANPLAGQRFRWDIELPFHEVGPAAHDRSAVVRTTVICGLYAWISLESHWWQMDSLATVLLRADGSSLNPRGWKGTHDLILCQVPAGADCDGRHGERLRARLRANDTALESFSVSAVASLTIDPNG